MPYTSFTAAQVTYLRQHYADLPPTHFAERWAVGVNKIYDLARRHGIKRRAPNGQPVWQQRGSSSLACSLALGVGRILVVFLA